MSQDLYIFLSVIVALRQDFDMSLYKKTKQLVRFKKAASKLQ